LTPEKIRKELKNQIKLNRVKENYWPRKERILLLKRKLTEREKKSWRKLT